MKEYKKLILLIEKFKKEYDKEDFDMRFAEKAESANFKLKIDISFTYEVVYTVVHSKYNRLMAMFGYVPLLILMEIFSEYEEYEKSDQILKFLKEFNRKYEADCPISLLDYIEEAQP